LLSDINWKKMKKIKILVLLLFPTLAISQATTGFHRVAQVIARAPLNSVTAQVVPQATVVLTNTSNGTAASVYSDPGLSVGIPNSTLTTDMSGNYNYYFALSTCITETISSPNIGIVSIPNICSNGGGGGGSGITQLTGPVTAGPGSGSQTTTITPTGVAAGSYGPCANLSFLLSGQASSATTVNCPNNLQMQPAQQGTGPNVIYLYPQTCISGSGCGAEGSFVISGSASAAETNWVLPPTINPANVNAVYLTVTSSASYIGNTLLYFASSNTSGPSPSCGDSSHCLTPANAAGSSVWGATPVVQTFSVIPPDYASYNGITVNAGMFGGPGGLAVYSAVLEVDYSTDPPPPVNSNTIVGNNLCYNPAVTPATLGVCPGFPTYTFANTLAVGAYKLPAASVSNIYQSYLVTDSTAANCTTGGGGTGIGYCINENGSSYTWQGIGAPGVASINGTPGAFTFSFSSGAGSCSGTTCTFTGSGAGGGSVTNFVASSGSWPSWLVPSVATSTTTPTLSVSASAIPNASLATQTANTVLGALTATTPSGLALPSCSGTTNALIWTSGTGFGCNTLTAAAAGSSGQIQYNSSGAFAGFTMSGDATVVPSTGVITVTKSNGTVFGTAAFATLGNSGTDVPQLSSGLLSASILPLGTSSVAGALQCGFGTSCTGGVITSTGVPYPSGTGIPGVVGGSAWATNPYNASNLIPANFISTLNQNTTGNAATATSLLGTPTLCTTGNAPTGILSSGNATGCAPIGGSPLWSSLQNPTGNLALTMGSDTTTLTYGSTTGSADLFKLTDSPSNTGTGILLHITTASGSTEIPFQADANGVGCKIASTGLTCFGASHIVTVGANSGGLPSPVASSGSLSVDSSGKLYSSYAGAAFAGLCNATNGDCNTPTTLLATGIVDGEAPVTVTTGSSASLGGTYYSGYTYNEEGTAATAVTYTLPTAQAGRQYCVANVYNGSAPTTGTLTLQTSAAGQFLVYTDGTLSASGGYIISAGAARDSACVVGIDSIHWVFYPSSGTWSKH